MLLLFSGVCIGDLANWLLLRGLGVHLLVAWVGKGLEAQSET